MSKVVLVLGTKAPGGINAVIESYNRDGLFNSVPAVVVATHKNGSSWERASIAFRAFIYVFLQLARNRVSLLHLHSAMRGSFWRKSCFASMARLFSVPVIFHLHGSEMQPFYDGLGARAKKMVSHQLSAATQVVVLSKSWSDFVLKIAPDARVTVVPNHVANFDVGNVDASRDADEAVNFLFLGAVGKRKGIYELIQAFRSVAADLPHVHLYVGGDGELDKARALATELCILDKITFMGWVNGLQKENSLRMAHIYVLPSHNEGFPVSILEAMSYKLPVISTTVGGIPELVRDGLDGFLVKAGDVSALAAAMRKLATDPSARRQLGDSAQTRVVDQFSAERVMPLLLHVYGSSGVKPVNGV